MGFEYRIFFRRSPSSSVPRTSGGAPSSPDHTSSSSSSSSFSTLNNKKYTCTSTASILERINQRHDNNNNNNNNNNKLLSYIQYESPRTDLYIPHSADVGIKYRGVKKKKRKNNDNKAAVVVDDRERLLEVKCRIGGGSGGGSHSSDNNNDNDDNDYLGKGFEQWQKYYVKNGMEELPKFLKQRGYDQPMGLNIKKSGNNDHSTTTTVSIRKSRRFSKTRNGNVFVEETELCIRVNRNNNNNNNNININDDEQAAQVEQEEEEEWTTVSVEGYRSTFQKDYLAVKEIVLAICQEYVDEHAGTLLECCGYPEFVVNRTRSAVAASTTPFSVGRDEEDEEDKAKDKNEV